MKQCLIEFMVLEDEVQAKRRALSPENLPAVNKLTGNPSAAVILASVRSSPCTFHSSQPGTVQYLVTSANTA